MRSSRGLSLLCHVRLTKCVLPWRFRGDGAKVAPFLHTARVGIAGETSEKMNGEVFPRNTGWRIDRASVVD